MIYIVTLARYPLRPLPKYIDALKAQKGYWRIMPDVWLVCSDLSCQQLCNTLKTHLTEQDEIFVMRTKKEYYGFVNKSVWDWIHPISENDF